MIQGKLFHSDAETRQVASLICQNRGYRTNVMGGLVCMRAKGITFPSFSVLKRPRFVVIISLF